MYKIYELLFQNNKQASSIPYDNRLRKNEKKITIKIFLYKTCKSLKITKSIRIV
jgi:hypothetical protein